LKKKMLFLVVVILIAIMGYLYTRPIQPSLSIDKVYGIANVGDTILVNATLSNVPTCKIWKMTLVWDPTILRLAPGGPNSTRPAEGARVDVTEGPFMKEKGSTLFVINTADNERGFVDLGALFSGTGGVSGTGVIAIFNFTILGVGTTTVETRNSSLIIDPANHLIAHDEAYGLVTKDGPPPTWESIDFQNNLIIGEIVLLAAASSIIYWRIHPRTSKIERKKAELRPVLAPEDQRETD
jgi:hypothetical protein